MIASFPRRTCLCWAVSCVRHLCSSVLYRLYYVHTAGVQHPFMSGKHASGAFESSLVLRLLYSFFVVVRVCLHSIPVS